MQAAMMCYRLLAPLGALAPTLRAHAGLAPVLAILAVLACAAAARALGI